MRARDVLGKFTFVPAADVNEHRPDGAGDHYLTEDWTHRHAAGPLEFGLYWIPFLDEAATPLEDLTRGWKEDHRVTRGYGHVRGSRSRGQRNEAGGAPRDGDGRQSR